MEGIKLAIAALVLLGFVVIYGYLLYVSWRKAPLPVFTNQFSLVAGALAATVGTTVATMFGQELPNQIAELNRVRAEANIGETSFAHSQVPTRALKELVVVEPNSNWRDTVAAAYVVTYFALSFAAIITWVLKNEIPESVKSLAYITFGLMLNIARVAF